MCVVFHTERLDSSLLPQIRCGKQTGAAVYVQEAKRYYKRSRVLKLLPLNGYAIYEIYVKKRKAQ